MESIRYLRATCLMALPVIFFSAPLSAIENDEPKSIQLSRYSSLDIASIKARRNIMVSVVDEHFSDEIQTVGDAIVHLVRKYGYRVGRASPEDESQYYLFNLPLPETHREFSPFPLISTLALLGGEGFGVVVNPVRREVTYQLDAAYQGSLSDDEVQAAKSAWLTRHPVKSIDLHDSTVSCQGNTPTLLRSVCRGLFECAKRITEIL